MISQQIYTLHISVAINRGFLVYASVYVYAGLNKTDISIIDSLTIRCGAQSGLTKLHDNQVWGKRVYWFILRVYRGILGYSELQSHTANIQHSTNATIRHEYEILKDRHEDI